MTNAKPTNGRRTLCASCRYVRIITSAKGSRFLLCEYAATDPRFPKYPPQPVVRCTGYATVPEAEQDG